MRSASFVRKLCYTAPFLEPLSQQSTATTTAANPNSGTPITLPAAVVLLNSPANTAQDFDEYLTLWKRAQSACTSHGETVSSASGSCVFVCADGAYGALMRYCDAHGVIPSVSDGGGNAALCDALIGDMDSLEAQDWSRAAGKGVAMPTTHTTANMAEAASDVSDGNASAPFYFDGSRHATTSSIPDAIIELLHERVHNRTTTRAIVLPIDCQMTTDFQKCVLLLLRLQKRHRNDLVCYTTEPSNASQTEQLTRGAAHVDAENLVKAVDRLSVASARHGEAVLDDADEAARCATLLVDCSSTSNGGTLPCAGPPEGDGRQRTVVLPTVLVLGALGGRLDHELAAYSTICLFARTVNLILVNAQNMVFACYPDGITQWVPWPVSLDATAEQGAEYKAVSEAARRESDRPRFCGVIPFGPLVEMETTGMLYNIVKGRSPQRYTGYTQVDSYHFGFNGVISACNEVTDALVTIDARPLCHPKDPAGETPVAYTDPLVALFNETANTVNAPVIVTCQRQSSN